MSPAPSVDPTAFRGAMARWATGVSVVTALGPVGPVGLTVNAFLSVALQPPTILISLTHDADSTPVIDQSGRFAVNLLAADQRSLSERFARTDPPAEKFRGLEVRTGEAGLPLLADTLGALEARVIQRIDVADHRLFVGEVTAIHAGREAPPLVFYRSQYAAPDADGALHLPGRPKAPD
jgi:flavin reductase (DIM6/NTAB) family NADH-FMN oxidoreductase RutF